ncbi:hypothetical protein PALB_14830 [Pseudoalteromonas luteoviolacea B = ATCC 29581]|nr:hypothetical protein PALB_14830 [Pseudoalteromonas luteoviolacea B = ATCC 29581]
MYIVRFTLISFLLLGTFCQAETVSIQQQFDQITRLSDRTVQTEELKKLIETTAFSSVSDPTLRLNIQLKLSDYLAALSRHDEAADIIHQLLERHNADEMALIEIHFQQGSNAYDAGNYEVAERSLKISWHLAKSHNNLPAILRAVNRLSSVYHNTSRYLEAVELIFEHKPIALSLTDTSYLEGQYHQLGRNLEQLSEYQLALDYKQSAIALRANKQRSTSQQASDFYSLGQSYLDLNEYSNAKVFFKKSLELDEKTNINSDIGHSLVKLSQAHYGLNESEDALTTAQRAQTYFENHERNLNWAKFNEAKALMLKSNYSAALPIIDAVVKYLAPLKSDFHLYTDVLNAYAQLLMELQPSDPPYAIVNEAIELAKTHQFLQKLLTGLEIKLKIAKKFNDLAVSTHVLEEIIETSNRLNSQRLAVYKSASQSDLSHQRKDLQISQLEVQRLSVQTELAQQQTRNAFNITVSVVLLGIVLIISAIFYYRRRLAIQEKHFMHALMEQKNDMFSDISHDLKTPLTALSLTIEAMQHKLIPSDDEQLAKLHGKVNTLNSLISDISELAKLNSSDVKLHVEPVKVLPFLQDLCDDFKLLANEHHFNIALNLYSDLTISLDKLRMSQVIFNLISNAAKYTNKGGTIELDASIKKNNLSILLRDSAPSVPSEALPYLFERTFRVANGQEKGSGLGLAIVRRIITLHGGSVKARHSALGGLEIEVSLPITAIR